MRLPGTTMDILGAQIDAHNRNIVFHDTWGHLFPKGDYYEGTVRVLTSIYRDIIVLDEKIDIQGSPWWHEAINSFAYRALKNRVDCSVYELRIAVNVRTTKAGIARIFIKELSSKRLITAFK